MTIVTAGHLLGDVPLLGPEIGASLQLDEHLAYALRVSIQLTGERAKPFLLRSTLSRLIERVLLRGPCG